MSDLVWHNETRVVKSLIHWEHNPRRLTEKQAADLTASLEKFNLVEVPAINLDNMILAGHQRVKILMMLGRQDEEIDVRVPNRALTPDEAREYNIRSNKNLGEFDFDLLLTDPFNVDELIAWGFTQEELSGDVPTPSVPDAPSSDVTVTFRVGADVYVIVTDGKARGLAKERLDDALFCWDVFTKEIGMDYTITKNGQPYELKKRI